VDDGCSVRLNAAGEARVQPDFAISRVFKPAAGHRDLRTWSRYPRTRRAIAGALRAVARRDTARGL
ncbi:MAG: hypothetical protein M3069_31355, partial [Chloroflexota bacterium]|nr:hypothetical protein [Chloroflexota bacterium]